jgi:hypothetical protein
MSGETWKWLTAVAILAGTAFYGFYDVLAWQLGLPNGGSTESTTVGTWLDHSLLLCLALAFLIGHLYASGADPLTIKHLVAAAIGVLAGYYITRES